MSVQPFAIDEVLQDRRHEITGARHQVDAVRQGFFSGLPMVLNHFLVPFGCQIRQEDSRDSKAMACAHENKGLKATEDHVNPPIVRLCVKTIERTVKREVAYDIEGQPAVPIDYIDLPLDGAADLLM